MTAAFARLAALWTFAAAAAAQGDDTARQLDELLRRANAGQSVCAEVLRALTNAPDDAATRDKAQRLVSDAADAAVYQPRVEAALVADLEALLALPWLDASTKARVHCAIGETCFRLGELTAADSALAAAAAADAAFAFHVATRRCLVQITRGDMAAAFAMCELARAAAASDLDRRRTAQTRADLELRIGLFDDAARSLAAARGPDTGDPYDTLATLRLETELALALEDFAFARELASKWRQAAEAAAELGAASAQRAKIAQARATAGVGETAEALRETQSLLEDPSWPAVNRAPLQRLAIELLLQRGDASAARDVARTLAGGQQFSTLNADNLAAVADAELSDADLARERLVELRAALDEAWRKQAEDWRSLGERTGRLAFLQLRSRRNLASALLSAIVREGGDDAGDACLSRLLLAEGSGTSARELDVPAVAPREVRERLARDGARVLVYLPAPRGSHCVEVREHGSRCIELPSDSGLRAEVRALRALLANTGDENSIREQAAALLRRVAPRGDAEWLGSGPIVVVGRELLAGMPFEALPTDDADAPWLGLRTPISYLPSMRLGVWLSRRDKTPSSRATARFATGLDAADCAKWGQNDLVLTDEQMRWVLRGVADDPAKVLPRATSASFAEDPGAALALFAHGVYDATADAKNGFLLARDGSQSGAVFPADCAKLRMAPFTALAVCGAARTSLRRGDDGGGDLVDAAMRGGANCVLSSEFDLRVDDALAIVGDTIAHLARGLDASHALLEARKARARYDSHPSRFAAMRLDGLGSLVAPLVAAPARNISYRWALVSLLAVTIACCWIAVRGGKARRCIAAGGTTG